MSWRSIFFEPRITLVIFIIFMIGYLYILNKQDAFDGQFLNFGPSPKTKLFNMHIDTWNKTIIVYIVAFITSLMTSYYSLIMDTFIYRKLYNPAYTKKLNINKFWGYCIVTLDPIIGWILSIIDFFVSLTMELQFLVPQFLGSAIVSITYSWYKLSRSKFKNSKNKKL